MDTTRESTRDPRDLVAFEFGQHVPPFMEGRLEIRRIELTTLGALLFAALGNGARVRIEVQG